MDSSDAAMQSMHQSNQEGFVTIRAKLDSIYATVSKTTPERVVMQKFSMISIKPQARNVKVPPNVIDAGSAEVNSTLQ